MLTVMTISCIVLNIVLLGAIIVMDQWHYRFDKKLAISLWVLYAVVASGSMVLFPEMPWVSSVYLLVLTLISAKHSR